jgi:hypothetical protein
VMQVRDGPVTSSEYLKLQPHNDFASTTFITYITSITPIA